MELKKQSAYCGMELFVALPFPEWSEKFDPKQKARWRDILNGCTGSVTVNYAKKKGLQLRFIHPDTAAVS